MLERHLSKRKRSRVEAKKNGSTISLAIILERIKENIFRAIGEMKKKIQEIATGDRIFSGRPNLEPAPPTYLSSTSSPTCTRR
jgi:hypothetical protein